MRSLRNESAQISVLFTEKREKSRERAFDVNRSSFTFAYNVAI